MNGFCDGGKEFTGFFCFAVQHVGQDHRGVTKVFCRFCSILAKLCHTAGDLHGHIGKSFGCFHCKLFFHFLSQLQIIFFYDCKGFFGGRGIGTGGAGSNGIGSVPENITEGNAEYLGRSAKLSKPAALDSRKMFADGIHFHDICTAFQHLFGNIQKVCQSQIACRAFKQGGTSAGNQKENDVFFIQAGNGFYDFLCTSDSIFIG